MIRSVLVTGGNGFLGSRLVERLARCGDYRIHATYNVRDDRLLTDAPDCLTYHKCNLLDAREVSDIFAKAEIDAIIHTAALLGPQQDAGFPVDSVRHNIEAHANLLSLSLKGKIVRYVLCSSISVYDGERTGAGEFDETEHLKPESVYGWSKLAAETLLETMIKGHERLQGASLRLAGIHGNGRASGVIFKMMKNAIEGKPIRISDSSSRFRLLFLDDAVDAAMQALTTPMDGGYASYNVAGDETYTLPDLANKILQLTGGESVLEIDNVEARHDRVMDISKIREKTAYSPRSLDDNLSALYAHIAASSR